jgi:hypothetical protein
MSEVNIYKRVDVEVKIAKKIFGIPVTYKDLEKVYVKYKQATKNTDDNRFDRLMT